MGRNWPLAPNTELRTLDEAWNGQSLQVFSEVSNTVVNISDSKKKTHKTDGLGRPHKMKSYTQVINLPGDAHRGA